MTKNQKKVMRRFSKFVSSNSPDRLAFRQALIKNIAKCNEGGYVAIVEGGRDCDGTEVSGRVHIVPAFRTAVDNVMDNIYDGAEGPVWTYLERPSVAREIEPTWRDRALEAFENGHQHAIR